MSTTRKSILDMLDPLRATRSVDGNGHDIKSGAVFEQLVSFKPNERESCESTLFFVVHGFRRVPRVERSASFDFDKDDGSLMNGDQINFPPFGTNRSADNSIPFPPEKTLGHPLALFA